MRYKFRPLEELYWAVLVAAGTVLLLELVGLRPEAITDYRQWAVALGAGMVRAAAGAALDYIRRSVAGASPEDAETTVDRLLPVLEALDEGERAELTARLHLRGEVRGGRAP